MRYLILSMLILSSWLLQAQSDQNSAQSVVKIKTSYPGVDENGNPATVVNTSTGWSWNDPFWVVTTLHSVAGMEGNIEVCSTTGKCCSAKVVRVLKEADLALMQLDENLGLNPLTAKNVNPQSTETYFIWGYPHGVYTIQGDEIKFSRSLNRYPTLSDILTGNKLKQQLMTQGYPLPTAKIYRISSIIQPGHSGAPILTSKGEVIGIADGGLRGGTARINWAMPSEQYLVSLARSNESIPTKISLQQNLYSHSYYIPQSVNSAEIDSYVANAEAKSTVSSDKGTAVHKTWTASLEDIYWTLDEEDQADMDDFLSDGMYEILSNSNFDIYEDYNTGASFAVPFGAVVTYEDELFHIERDHSYLAFAPFNAPSFQEASNVMDLFISGILNGFEQHTNAINFENDDEIDEYNEYRNAVIFKEVNLDGSNYLLAVGGEVLGSNVAAMMMLTPLPREMNDVQMLEFLELALATEVISFSGQ
ncbi:MAG: serine protease [Reichenbachiella sp.]|uniref:S1 family peptidase n=1 Tax=Reichenbachiella sp. TaxID=2184521 RepID=UPI00329A5B4D